MTNLPDADATGNFKLLTNAMVYRVNTDNSGRATGVSYYGPDGSADNTVEAEIVIVSPFIYDAVRLLLAVEDGKIPGWARQFQRASRPAPDVPYRRAGVRRVRRPPHQRLHGAERPEAHDRRLQRRQLRSQRARLHPRLADLGRSGRPRRRPDRIGHERCRRRPASRAGARAIATSSPSTTRATWR